MTEDRVERQLSEDESKSNTNVSELIMDGDLADRKITRNQKRKHDEINHVQKVKLKTIHNNENYLNVIHDIESLITQSFAAS